MARANISESKRAGIGELPEKRIQKEHIKAKAKEGKKQVVVG